MSQQSNEQAQPQASEIKIRTLPRSAGKNTSEDKKSQGKAFLPRWIIYLGSLSLILLVSSFVLPQHFKAKSKGKPAVTHQTDMSSIATSTNVSRHLQESLMKAQVMRTQQTLDNMNAPVVGKDLTGMMLEENPDRTYGVQLDSEDTADRLFKDLNERNEQNNYENLPDDRINARLANRRWLNQAEREERINFIRQFIRSAYDRGYQVEIDQNLVVVGVKKITEQKVSIDQVIDRMAQQGKLGL